MWWCAISRLQMSLEKKYRKEGKKNPAKLALNEVARVVKTMFSDKQ